jgi:lipid II:glycine glycyltransferase (peptidoglycan interpeptide bridge formation enzyme)
VIETGEMLTALINYAKEKKFKGISMLRLAPSSLQTQFSEDQHYWLHQLGFAMTRCEMDGAIDLCGLTKDSIMESLTGKCRNMVRQAERANINVRVSNDFATFWPILESVLTARHAVKPTHTVSEIQRLHELLPNGFRLLAAYNGKIMVGGIVLVTINDSALYTLYMAQEYAAQQHHPMHLLLTEAIKLGLKEKKKVLHLGVSTEDGGKKVNEGLFFFKESFGCRPVRRESYEIIF